MSDRIEKQDFQRFTTFYTPMLQMEVTHIWQGAGSAIFLEAGRLTPRRRLDGSAGNAEGEMGLMIEWSWRIEDESHILGGSWSDDDSWPGLFNQLLGSQIVDICLFGRLPEVQITFSNGLYLCSLMTADGDPEWALFDRRHGETKSVGVRSGILNFEGREHLKEVHRYE
jgi:hypothetical protein